MVSTPKNILLVEDEPTLQRILGSVLTDAGHRVESVGTAEQALDRLQNTGAPDVDLVLSDKNLPAMSGLDLLGQVRAFEKKARRTVAFVLVTGYLAVDPEYGGRVRELGAKLKAGWRAALPST